MQLNPAEISELIKSRIEGLAGTADVRNQGTVVSVADGIPRIHAVIRCGRGGLAQGVREAGVPRRKIKAKSEGKNKAAREAAAATSHGSAAD